MKPGNVIAAALRLDVEVQREEPGGWGGFQRECLDCGRLTIAHFEDGRCPQCLSPGEPAMSTEERKRAVEELFEVTLDMLWNRADEHLIKADRATTEQDTAYHLYAARLYRDEAQRMESRRRVA